ncbi:MAG: hypothetical protein IMZ44_19155 [Planctomycetes bacterium]|nr:hypothetical protein [Planctomycetota bacterium]
MNNHRLSVPDIAGHVWNLHGGFFVAMLEKLVSPNITSEVAYPLLGITDDVISSFASRAYLIQLGYVGLLANPSLGGGKQMDALVQLLYNFNARRAREEIESLRQKNVGERERRLLRLLPASMVGCAPDEVKRFTKVFQGIAIFGVESQLKDLARPLIDLGHSEPHLPKQYKMAFRLAFPSFLSTFHRLVSADNDAGWEAIIRVHWKTWHMSWQFLAEKYEKLFDGAVIDAEEVRLAPDLPANCIEAGSRILAALYFLSREDGLVWRDKRTVAEMVQLDTNAFEKGLEYLLGQGQVEFSRSQDTLCITPAGMQHMRTFEARMDRLKSD